MYRPDTAELHAAREQLVRHSARLLADGLAIGSAGNLSVRCGDLVAITPSGIGYDELQPADIAIVAMDGTEVNAPEVPSSETPMHLAVYASSTAGAIAHTHSPEVIALSAARDELPAIHYAITQLGGPVRVAPYVRFGSDALAGAAAGALEGRRAAILRNHGAICYGRTLAEAYDRALLLEWLAGVYRLAQSYGDPKTLSQADLDEVTAEARRRRYGQRRVHREDAGGPETTRDSAAGRDGAGGDSAAPDGAGRDGAGRDSAAPDGAGRGGARSGGAAAGGAGRGGAAPGGAGHGGAVPGGAGRDRGAPR